MNLIWAFAPYRCHNAKLDGDCYDTLATKAETAAAFHQLGLPWIWQPIVPASLDDIVAQVAESRRDGALVFNFCDGDDINGYPGVSVVRALERAAIPFTGAESPFYEISTSKLATKQALLRAGVPTAPWAPLPRRGAIRGICARLGTPLLVKPAVSAEGWGLSPASVASNDAELTAARNALLEGELGDYFQHDTLFAERFVNGPEYTVFLAGYADQPAAIWHLPAVERVFSSTVPPHARMICNEQPGAPFFRDEPCPRKVANRAIEIARRAFLATGGSGYARVDLRHDLESDEILVLEVNANPGITADPTHCAVGRMLQLARMSYPELLGRLLRQAEERFAGREASARIAVAAV